MNIAAHTLGCKLNYAETSDLLRNLVNLGHTIVGFDEHADVYIINTCTVTAMAEKKCRNAIRQAIAQNDKAKIAVIGCFAQNAANEISKISGVSVILGNDKKHLLPDVVKRWQEGEEWRNEEQTTPETFQLQYSSGDRTRAFFKIQDGCDYFCSYCAIPLARGRSRSATIDQTIESAKKIADSGAKEVVLTGVNTGTFGQKHGESLIELMKQLDDISSILRFRISSIEPNLITREMIDFVHQSRAFLPHFHIPIQAASDEVLRLMHRRYDTALFAEKVNYIKSVMPEACIASDIMAGFNGETEELFAQSMRFLESIPISYLHVFTYSERPNTAAKKMTNQIPISLRREHTAQLISLSQKKHNTFIESQIGTTREVLWESTMHNGAMQGWTDNYIRLCRPYDASMVNQIEAVEIREENIIRQD